MKAILQIIILLSLSISTFAQTASDYIISDNSAFISMGSNSLYYSRTGHTGTANVAIGSGVLKNNTHGRRNTGVGHNALFLNNYGKGNTALGSQALSNVVGLYTWTFNGLPASRPYGNFNTAVGDSSLYNNFFGDYNTALGYKSLSKHSGSPWAAAGTRTAMGYHNLAVGSFALHNDNNGNENIAIGSYSLFSNNGNGIPVGYINGDGGNRNLALGYKSLYSNTLGNQNIAIGYQSLYNNITTNNNIAIGYNALYSLTNNGITNPSPNGGGGNIAIGYMAGRNSNNGENIFLGNSSGLNNSSGSNNLFLGNGAGYNESGSNTLYIENSNSATPLIGGDFANDIVGVNMSISSLSTNPSWKLQVGGDINASGSVRAAGVVLSSDMRFKKNIAPLQNSLSNLLKVNAVSYYWRNDDFAERNFSNKKQFGVIAQEIETIFPELVDTDSQGFKSVNYTALVPLMIEAIKELNQKITLLENQSNHSSNSK